MYTNNGPFYRNPDGSIDFDRYRIEAVALRRQAMKDSSRLGAAFKLAVIVVVMLAAVAVAPSRQDANACHDCVKAPAPVERTLPPSRSLWNFVPQHEPIY